MEYISGTMFRRFLENQNSNSAVVSELDRALLRRVADEAGLSSAPGKALNPVTLDDLVASVEERVSAFIHDVEEANDTVELPQRNADVVQALAMAFAQQDDAWDNNVVFDIEAEVAAATRLAPYFHLSLIHI